MRNGILQTVLLAAVVACVPLAKATAEEAADAITASPDVYRLLSDTDALRAVEAVWEPGQRDEFHSHPALRATIYLTDCELRVFTPDGAERHISAKAGEALVTESPVASHSVENAGEEACRIIIVEEN